MMFDSSCQLHWMMEFRNCYKALFWGVSVRCFQRDQYVSLSGLGGMIHSQCGHIRTNWAGGWGVPKTTKKGKCDYIMGMNTTFFSPPGNQKCSSPTFVISGLHQWLLNSQSFSLRLTLLYWLAETSLYLGLAVLLYPRVLQLSDGLLWNF